MEILGKKRAEKISEEMMAKNFPNLMKNINIQSKKLNELQIDSTPTHIIVKLLKDKDKNKILKVARKITSHVQGNLIRLTANFSSETMKARRQWDN